MRQIVGCRRVRAALSMSDRWQTALATIWLVAMTATGSATANAPPTAIRDNTLDEILIEAPSLGSLREQMVRLEDEFYRRYNDLNSNDLFDVHCAREAPTGSRLKRRYCRAVFEMRALQKEGSEHWVAVERSTREMFPLDWVPPVPAAMNMEMMKEDLRKEIRRVTEENPELVELLRQRAEVEKRYERLRRTRFDR